MKRIASTLVLAPLVLWMLYNGWMTTLFLVMIVNMLLAWEWSEMVPNKKKSISYAKYGYLFILPFFIVYFFFQVYPLCYTFYLSTQSNGDVVTESVGLDNFKIILTGEPTTTPGHVLQSLQARTFSEYWEIQLFSGAETLSLR